MATGLIAATSGQGKRADVGDVTLYYEEQGTGDAVLLLHGGIMDHQSWGNQIPVLAEHFRVIAPDTRGHGRSTDSEEPFRYATFAQDMVALLRQLGIERTHVVGFSDGGCTGLILGVEHSELLNRLVLIGTPYNTSNYPEGTVEQFAAFTPEMLSEMATPELSEVVAKAQAQYETQEAWKAYWRKLVNDMWTREPAFTLEYLRSVKVRTLIVHAENETFYDRKHSEDMARAIPEADLTIIPGATHTSPQENPDAVNAAILKFLREA